MSEEPPGTSDSRPPEDGGPLDRALADIFLHVDNRRKTGGEADRQARRARRRRRLEAMSSEDLATEGKRRDLVLRERVAMFALSAVTVELLIANAVFVAYAWAGVHWRVPVAAIDVWLGATVVQIVGILYVIATYLFPSAGTPLTRE